MYFNALHYFSLHNRALFQSQLPERLKKIEEHENIERRRRHSQKLLSASAPATITSTNLLCNFEESVLNGRLEPVSTVEGFTAEIGASGSFHPKHTVLPVTVFFYTLCDNATVSSPYLGKSWSNALNSFKLLCLFTNWFWTRSNLISIIFPRSHQRGEEGLPRASKRHHSGDPLQPFGHRGQDVCRHVRPVWHAAQFADVSSSTDVVHAVGLVGGQQWGCSEVAEISCPSKVQMTWHV